MKPLQGPTPVAAQMAPIPVKSSPIDLDTEGRVGEAFGLPARSRFGEGRAATDLTISEGVPDPDQTLICDTDESHDDLIIAAF